MKQWLALAAAAATWSCSSDSAKTESATDTAKPAAAMATGERRRSHRSRRNVPVSALQKWFSDYAAKTGVKINYQSIGSGGGIRPASGANGRLRRVRRADERRRHGQGQGRPGLHIPTVLGAGRSHVQPSRRRRSRCKLTGPVVADIFLGKITKWNDPRIAALNPGVKLPATDILVVHRIRRQRHDLHLHRLSRRREPGVEERPGQGQRSAVAGRTRRQRAMKASPAR